MFQKLQVLAILKSQEVREKVVKFLKDEKGEFVGSIGMWAIGATLLVIVHGILTGWLPNFINNLLAKLETL